MYMTTDSLEENAKRFASIVGPTRNFDIIAKNSIVMGRKAKLYTIDGFAKDDILEKILEFMAEKDEIESVELEALAEIIPYSEVTARHNVKDAVKDFLMGMSCLIVDGYAGYFMIDCRTYPARSVSEPWKNRVLRGSRDGFVETLVSNVALIRRRVRTPKFSVEILNAGTMSHTDIAIAYIQGKADMKLLDNLKERIAKIDVEALSMNIESLAEVLLQGPYINPFPKFKYSERPDSTAAALYDGNIVLLIDNSPAVLIVPATIFDISEEADDYYFPPLTGTYIKLTRYMISVFSLVMTPLWLLMINHPEYTPKWLEFVHISEHQSTVPVFLQLIILEFCIDGLRLAAVNTPSLLSTPLSVIAGIVVGEYAVSTGWFDSESMLYMAFVTIGTYTQASYELGYAIKFFRMLLLVLVNFFALWGFIAGMIIFCMSIAFNRTISQKSYIYPLIPFDAKMLARKLFRLRLGKEK